ncbi:TonB-dependent receptor [Kaistia sp. 32K]|uniref:TonB-dependent receptor plug domain-containing protein n=1 Tax=Kaistia sp. 32K TaxID=2795690 RepID=UPI0019155352|nr:TonB-dependent receptor [Kaistia sp. 32K]BCP53439.1 TonB-dependent receptor [Kaistia sp. 32K]
MTFSERRRGRAALSLFASLPVMLAAGAASADQLDDIVVTAYRSPTDITKSGSAITVIPGDKINNASPGSLVDVLRQVPGVTVTQSGGPGGTTEVSIRGAEAGDTLVLIDGVRVNDPASARNTFDFAVFSPTDIERVEVLRGPQSALYGSDAMGGVINIITRKRTGALTATAGVEGGSYGTVAGNATAGGSVGPVSLSVSGTAFDTHGFSRVGDRDDGEADGTRKFAGTARGSYDSGEGKAFSFGVTAYRQESDVDRGSKPTDDLPGYERNRDVVSGFGRFDFESFDGKIANQINFFGTQTTSAYIEPLTLTNKPSTSFLGRVGDSTGLDYGVEYQGTIDLARYGTLIVGGRAERESGEQDTTTTSLAGVDKNVQSFDDARTLLAVYALQQFTLFDNLNLSLGGRYDEDVDGQGFLTGRATAAYLINPTGTKLRGSFGNAAKRPTMFQLFDAQYGNPDLIDEESWGGDVGIDQELFDGRVQVSATGFYNRFTNLISYSLATNDYINITNAETSGLELSADAVLVPSVLKATGTYTYLHATNLDSGLPLSRRPENSGSLTLTYTGIENFEFGATAIFVGERFNNDPAKAAQLVPLDGYTKIDLNASYRLNPQTTLYARLENLTNVEYQDAFGYNNAGRSGYVGLRWTH